jgi:hypothetical protein
MNDYPILPPDDMATLRRALCTHKDRCAGLRNDLTRREGVTAAWSDCHRAEVQAALTAEQERTEGLIKWVDRQ